MLSYQEQSMLIVVAIMIFAIVLIAVLKYTNLLKPKRSKSLEDKKAVADFLSALNGYKRFKEIEIIQNPKLTFEGKTYEYDAILLSFFGCMALKVSCRNGDIYGELNSENWVQIIEDQRTEFKNPLKDLEGSDKFLKSIFRVEKTKVLQVETAIVIAAKGAIPGLSKPIPFFTIKSLIEALKTSKYTKDNGAQINEMKEALLKYKS